MADSSKAGKAMSSRLATMKFMQRGSSSANSPSSTSPSTALDSRPSKRPRLSNGASPASLRSSPNTTSPSTPADRSRSEVELVNDALASEEQKRNEAVEREGWARGETKWYLSVQEPKVKQSPLRIVQVGYATLDKSAGQGPSSEEEEEVQQGSMPGRRTFGNFKRGKQDVDKDPESSSSGSDSSEDGANEEDDPTGAGALIAQTRKEAGEKARAERKAKRKADESEARRLADERRKKHVKLNQLSSISGGGTGSPLSKGRASVGGREDRACYNCGEKGHEKRDCPRGR